MFSKEDFSREANRDLNILEFAPIFIFIALVLPFVGAAYGLGFVMDLCGWLDKA